jgi:predicted lipoprotein with Yx(FWY)xxD motif
MLVAALVAISAIALVGVALATSMSTLNVAKNKVGTATHSVVVNSKGFAVYWLSADSKTDQKCTKKNGCWGFWPPVKSSKPTEAAGIKGTVGTWKHDGISQVTLSGHPLYTFVQDKQPGTAHGNLVKGFGGTWYVATSSGSKITSNKASGGTTTPKGGY